MHVPCWKRIKYQVPFCNIWTQKSEWLMVLAFIIIIYPFLTPVLHDQCLRPPYGVLYLATKRNYVGFSNGARQLRSLVDEEGVFGAHLVKEMTDRDVWKFFIKWNIKFRTQQKYLLTDHIFSDYISSNILFVYLRSQLSSFFSFMKTESVFKSFASVQFLACAFCNPSSSSLSFPFA